jgi:hypothetical protein
MPRGNEKASGLAVWQSQPDAEEGAFAVFYAPCAAVEREPPPPRYPLLLLERDPFGVLFRTKA